MSRRNRITCKGCQGKVNERRAYRGPTVRRHTGTGKDKVARLMDEFTCYKCGYSENKETSRPSPEF